MNSQLIITLDPWISLRSILGKVAKKVHKTLVQALLSFWFYSCNYSIEVLSSEPQLLFLGYQVSSLELATSTTSKQDNEKSQKGIHSASTSYWSWSSTMYACQSQEWLFSAAAYLFQMHIDPRQTRHLWEYTPLKSTSRSLSYIA